MNTDELVEKRKFFYHLTDEENLANIIKVREILSTESIVNLTNWEQSKKESFLSNRRKNHETININSVVFKIRDQKPISLKNLIKCLSKGMSTGDFFKLLNMRVFFWPTLKRLNSHFKRYAFENPIIIRVDSAELLKINPNAEFCRLNSGATRSNSHLNGAPPERGPESFQPAEKSKLKVSQVAEVTFPYSCKLPFKFHISKNPDGPWQLVNL